MRRLLLLANTDWYLFNHRLALAKAAREEGMMIILASPRGSYVPKLEAEGFEWFEVPMERGSVNIIREIHTLIHCIRLYRRLKPDLVHHFTIKPVFYGSLAARWVDVPVIVNSITGLGYLFSSRSQQMASLRYLLKPLYKKALGHPNQIMIFQHTGDLETYLDLGLVREEKSVIIPGSGVDLNRFVPREEPSGIPVVMMATRMLWDKGVGDLIKVAESLKIDGPDVRVVLVGQPDSGNPSSIPEKTLIKWHEAGVIEWLGHQDNMPDLFAQAHIVVLPSYSEGIPKSLIEAAAMKKPIISTDLPGCREIVQHGRSGFLVIPGDLKALKEAITRLVQDKSLREEMGSVGRQIALERFNDRMINDQILLIYSEHLKKSMKETSYD
jgi:glycosyltransferase involved in cell wall biosynthesis